MYNPSKACMNLPNAAIKASEGVLSDGEGRRLTAIAHDFVGRKPVDHGGWRQEFTRAGSVEASV